MTREEAIEVIRKEYACVDADCDIERSCGKCELHMPSKEPILRAYEMAIKALSQEPCVDAVSRDAILDALLDYWHDIQFVDGSGYDVYEDCKAVIDELPSVTQKSETETWNGIHGQITAPKGTFKKIFDDAESEDKK